MPNRTSPIVDKSPEALWAGVCFAALLVLSILFTVALSRPAAPGSFGIPHPDFATMLRGGDGVARHGHLLWLGWAIGAAQIVLFAVMMALGARRGPSCDGDVSGGGLRGLGWPLAAVTAGCLGVWTLLMVTYAGYLEDPDPGLVMALPAPTATMIYALWALPVLFAVLYVAGFRRWVYSPADQAAFEALVRKRQAAEAGHGDGGA
ncbi:MAG: hypothetical protein AAGF23_01570 [Acidobacteriota bacterium]